MMVLIFLQSCADQVSSTPKILSNISEKHINFVKFMIFMDICELMFILPCSQSEKLLIVKSLVLLYRLETVVAHIKNWGRV